MPQIVIKLDAIGDSALVMEFDVQGLQGEGPTNLAEEQMADAMCFFRAAFEVYTDRQKTIPLNQKPSPEETAMLAKLLSQPKQESPAQERSE